MIPQIKLKRSIKLAPLILEERPRTCSPPIIVRIQTPKYQHYPIKNNLISSILDRSIQKIPHNKPNITRKPRLNRSQIIPCQFQSPPSRFINPEKMQKIAKDNKHLDKTKLFKGNNHVPSIFKKNKIYIKQNILIEDQHIQDQKFNNLNSLANIQQNSSKELETSYDQDETIEAEKKQTQIQHFIVPKIIINKLQQNNFKENTDYPIKQPSLIDFSIGELLGKGSYGSVRVARHKLTGFFYAMKTYSKIKIQENIDRFISSVKLQMYTKHPNIAQVYCVFQEEDSIYLLMELCIDGDLFQNVKSLKNKKEEAKEIIKGVVWGLIYLHEEQIIHRDIKLQNILLCYNMPKITDFDLAIYQKNPSQYRKTFCGSPAYFSPQMLSTTVQYNNKVDIWSLGILIHQILCGYYPFQITSDLTNIINCQIKPFSIHVPEIVRSLIMIMLVKNPDERATWEQIQKHPYFT